MSVTAEQLNPDVELQQPNPVDFYVPDFFPEEWTNQQLKTEHAPLVMAVPEMAEDAARRDRAAQFIGNVLIGHEAEPSYEAHLTVQPIESLFDAVQKAAEGNQEAYRMVETNVKTDVIERTMKAGHINSVDLMVDAAGRIQQYGQSMESVQANSLRFAAENKQMRERTEAETRNSFRIQELYEKGTLDDYNFVVFSRAADNMSDADMADVGFFTDTMTCMIQVTSASEEVLTTESASVAGVASPGQERHDAAAVAAVAQRLGHDLAGKSAAEVLDTPLLVHKDLMPNGAIDLVEMYDDAAGGTFFGQDKSKQDYKEYLQVCHDREERFQPKVDEITQELVQNAFSIRDRVQATQVLGKLSEKAMVTQAIKDKDINPLVFGKAAAMHIEEARDHLIAGNLEFVQQLTMQAQNTAVSSSCPSAMKKGKDFGLPGLDGESEGSADEDEYGSLTFECTEGHTNTRPRGKLISKCGTKGCKGTVGC